MAEDAMSIEFQDTSQLATGRLEGQLTTSKKDVEDSNATVTIVPASRGNEGQSQAGRSVPHFRSTLNEPIRDTIVRDLKAVGVKLFHVCIPTKAKNNILLKEWDLWGPFLLCLTLGILLDAGSKQSNGPQFAQIFILFWVGTVICTANAKLLRCSISFLQCVCVLGYCVLPLVLALFVTHVVSFFVSHQFISLFVRLLIVMGCAVWSVLAACAFLGDFTTAVQHRKALLIYPIALFYTVLAFMILGK